MYYKIKEIHKDGTTLEYDDVYASVEEAAVVIKHYMIADNDPDEPRLGDRPEYRVVEVGDNAEIH